MSVAVSSQPVNFCHNYKTIHFLALSGQLTPTCLAGWLLIDYLEVVERCGRHSPPHLRPLHREAGVTGGASRGVAAVQAGDPLAAPLLAVGVERIRAAARLQHAGKRAGPSILLLLHRGEGERLAELRLGQVGGRDAGGDLPGGGRSQVTQANLPGAGRTAGQRY